MADHIGAYVYVKDAGGRYLYANAAVCAFYGATPDQVLGACDAQFIDVGQSPRLQANDAAVLATGQAVHDEEEVVLRGGARRAF
jgi:PAS domain-containing protein